MLNKKKIWLLSACLLSCAAAPGRLWAARDIQRVYRRRWHPAHIQPQTDVINLLSASCDSAKTKGSCLGQNNPFAAGAQMAWKCFVWHKVLENVWLTNMGCQNLFSSSCQPVIVFWKPACSQENHFHQKQKPCLYFSFVFSYQVISLSNVTKGIIVELRNSQNFSPIT